MPRLAIAALVLSLGCSSSEPTTAPVDAAEVGTCTAPDFLVYPRAGCGGSVTAECASPADTACVHIVCGCDGKIHTYDCAGPRAPYSSRVEGDGREGDDCSDAGVVDGGADTSTADSTSDTRADSGSCEAGTHVGYFTPGCTAPVLTCLADGPEDACLSTFCDCEGKTHFGACGYANKPFASTGPCPDAGDGG